MEDIIEIKKKNYNKTVYKYNSNPYCNTNDDQDN